MKPDAPHHLGMTPDRRSGLAHSPSRPRETSIPPSLGQGAECESVTVDCDACTMRGIGCGDCVITVLLGGPPYGVELDADERRAIDVLSAAGLVPPLRMVEALDDVPVEPP